MALVLTRAVGESIVINGNIEITVYEIRKRQVRIGINAPREIPVIRSELSQDEKGKEEGQ